MKSNFLPIMFSALLLTGCGEDLKSLSSTPTTKHYSAAVDQQSYTYLNDLQLNSNTSANGHGTCSLSSDKKTVTYTRTDTSYAGSDSCSVSWGCDETYTIDFSQPSPQLIAGGAICYE